MARFLFTVWPFVGHINPFLSVAKALQERGHAVAFYTGALAQGAIEDEGFTVFPLRHVEEDQLWAHIEAAEIAATGPLGRLRLVRAVFHDWLAGTIPDQVTDLQAIRRAWQPDVVATDPIMWGPSLVLSELIEPPVAILSTWIGCPIPGPDAPPWGLGLRPPRTASTRLLARMVGRAGNALGAPLRGRIDEVRGHYGLPPLGEPVAAFPARLPLYLVPSIPELDYDRRDLPPSVRYVGPCVWNKPSHAEAPAWLDELPADRPWVHVTEGTAHYHDPIVLRAAARGLGGAPVQAILTAGPQRDPASLDLGPLAPNVRLERWVSHADLLPRCAAMVTTGGAGTVMAGLQAGVPLVIVPTRWDKPDNAQRVVEAGAGVRLDPARCTPARLRKAVERLLSEPGFRRNARRLACRLSAEAGPARAADLLEGLAASHACGTLGAGMSSQLH